MTQDQLMGLLRQLLPVIGGLALAFGVSQSEVNYWTALVLQIAGPLSIIAGTVVLRQHQHAAIRAPQYSFRIPNIRYHHAT